MEHMRYKSTPKEGLDIDLNQYRYENGSLKVFTDGAYVHFWTSVANTKRKAILEYEQSCSYN
jgi:hypothetical protein